MRYMCECGWSYASLRGMRRCRKTLHGVLAPLPAARKDAPIERAVEISAGEVRRSLRRGDGAVARELLAAADAAGVGGR